MKVLLYASDDDEDKIRVTESIQGVVPAGMLELYSSVGSLSRRLREILTEPTVAVLLASSQEELSKIVSFREALRGVHILLIAPDQQEQTLAIAHQLRPRFLTDRESDYSELCAVIVRKMNVKLKRTPKDVVNKSTNSNADGKDKQRDENKN